MGLYVINKNKKQWTSLNLMPYHITQIEWTETHETETLVFTGFAVRNSNNLVVSTFDRYDEAERYVEELEDEH